MKLIVLCGIPGSGKTTLSHKLAQEHNAALYCYDALPEAHNPKKHIKVHQDMWFNALCDLQNDKSVVIDDLHTTLTMRSDLLNVFSNVNCEKVIIVMKTPFDVCIQRNVNRTARLPNFILRSLYERFDLPTLEEGWSEIIYNETRD